MSIPITHTGEHTTVQKVSTDGLTFFCNRRDFPDLREHSEITALVMRYRQPSVRGKLGIVTLRSQPDAHQGEAHGWWLDHPTEDWKPGDLICRISTSAVHDSAPSRLNASRAEVEENPVRCTRIPGSRDEHFYTPEVRGFKRGRQEMTKQLKIYDVKR